MSQVSNDSKDHDSRDYASWAVHCSDNHGHSEDVVVKWRVACKRDQGAERESEWIEDLVGGSVPYFGIFQLRPFRHQVELEALESSRECESSHQHYCDYNVREYCGEVSDFARAFHSLQKEESNEHPCHHERDE